MKLLCVQLSLVFCAAAPLKEAEENVIPAPRHKFLFGKVAKLKFHPGGVVASLDWDPSHNLDPLLVEVNRCDLYNQVMIVESDPNFEVLSRFLEFVYERQERIYVLSMTCLDQLGEIALPALYNDVQEIGTLDPNGITKKMS